MAETDSIRRAVFLYDQHYPHCISAFYDITSPKKKTPLLRFLKDFSPQIVVHGGDQMDLEAISFWNRGKPRLKEGARLAKDYEGYNYVLDAIETATPHATEKYMLEGNHELRIQHIIDEQPELAEGLIEVPKNLRLRQRGIKWIPSRGLAQVGKLYCMHGDWKQGILPQHHTRQALLIYHRNLLYGHAHTNMVSTSVSPVDTHPYQAWCIGTLANVNPYWRRDEASAWVNSFAVGYFHKSGDFSLSVINIINGSFIYDGVVYK